MNHFDLLMRVGDSKKLVCHHLPDILFAGNHVALANLGFCVLAEDDIVACLAWQWRR